MEVCLVARARVRDARSDGLVTTMLSDLIQATACGSEEGGGVRSSERANGQTRERGPA